MPRATWEDLQFGVDLLPGQPQGLLAPGTIDLASRPIKRNPDGTISTVLSMSIGTPQGEVLIPQIGQKGELYTPQQAIEAYNKTGYHLGIFNTPGAANLYANDLHASQANEYVEHDSPSWMDTWDATLRLNNPATNMYELMTRDNAPAAQAGYNAYLIPGELDGYDEDPETRSLFFRSRSHGETQQIKEREDERRAQQRLLASAGWRGVALTFASGTLQDPFNIAAALTPITGFAAVGAAASRTTRVIRGVAAQAVFDTASETVLHANQQSRTIGESLENIGMSALFGAAIGTLATKIPKAEYLRLQEKAEKELRRLDPETYPPTSSTAGAAQVGHNTTLADEGIAPGAATIAATVGKASPLTRALQSPAKYTRILTQKLADIPYLLGKNLRGIATTLGVEAKSTTRVRRAYAESVLMATRKFDDYLQTKPAKALTWDEFKTSVTKAMREGDTHAVAQVQDVARETRKIFDLHRSELQALKVLPEDLHIVGAQSYFPRVYNHHAIRANRMAFEDVLRQWFRENPVPTKVIRQIEKDGKSVEEHIEKMVPREPVEVEAAVQDAMDNILGSNGANVGRGTGNPRSLKSRELDVPDELLAPYLINDYEQVMSSYLHSMIPQIEMRKMFGDISIEHELQKVRDEFHIMISHAESNVVKKELEKRMSADQEDIRGLWARALGQTTQGMQPEALVRWSRITRNANYTRSLGMMLGSSFSDYGHVMTRYGATKTIAATVRFLSNSVVRKLTREQANKFGAAQDLLNDRRAATMGDLSADVPTGGRIDTGLHRLSAKFTKLTGMSHWNTGIKFLAMALEQDAVTTAIKKGASISKYKKGLLAQMGIGDDMLARIGRESEHFANDGGIWRLRTELWKDQDAAKVMEAAIIRAGDIMTITRGVGDTPLLMDGPLAKLLLQFKGFGITAVNRIMIPVAQGIAHGDASTIFGASFMLALGGLSYVTKEIVAGREPDLSPEVVAMQMLNWSGLLGYIPDMWDPLVGGVFGAPRFSKYSDQQPIETLLGPTLGLATDVYNVVKNDKNEWGITQKDIHAVRKIFPMQNLFYFRRILDALEGETAQAFGASDAEQKTFAQRFKMTAAAKSEPTGAGGIAAGIGVAAIAIALGVRSARQLQALALGGKIPTNALEEGAMAAKGFDVNEGALASMSHEDKIAMEALRDLEKDVGIAAHGASHPDLARHYAEIAEMLKAKLAKGGPDALQSVSVEKMVASLDKVVAPDSEFRQLVDKLVAAKLPGKVFFGNTEHMQTMFANDANRVVREGLARGAYSRRKLAGVEGTDHIVLNMDTMYGNDTGHVLMHELTHAGTVRKLADNPQVRIELQDIQRRTFGTPTAEGPKVSGGHYGNVDTEEFLAEGWGNLELKKAMKRIGTWDDFVKATGKLFGITGAGLVVLDKVMSLPEEQQQQPTA